MASGIKMIDKILIFAATAAALAALGCALFLAFFLKDTGG
jgi:hypothetical protein